jgi:hypothetical protein
MAWIEPVTLSREHVVLEPAADRHIPDLLAAGQDDGVWAWLPWARPEREADVAAILDSERAVALPFAQVRNERSQAAIARLGAVREGVLRHQYVRRDGSLRDTVLYSIVPAEWPNVKARLEARLAAHA